MEKRKAKGSSIFVEEHLVPDERVDEIAENAKKMLKKEFGRAMSEYNNEVLSNFSSSELKKFLEACVLDAAHMNAPGKDEDKNDEVPFLSSTSPLIRILRLGMFSIKPAVEIYFINKLRALPVGKYVADSLLPDCAYAIINDYGHYSLVSKEEEEEIENTDAFELLKKIKKRNDHNYTLKSFKPIKPDVPAEGDDKIEPRPLRAVTPVQDILPEEQVYIVNDAEPLPEKGTMAWKKKRFKEHTQKMYDIFSAKNSDYTANKNIGSAFDMSYNLIGPVAPAVRFIDKISRYISLVSGKEQMVKDEKVEDTLIDLANYAILTLLKREEDND